MFCSTQSSYPFLQIVLYKKETLNISVEHNVYFVIEPTTRGFRPFCTKPSSGRTRIIEGVMYNSAIEVAQDRDIRFVTTGVETNRLIYQFSYSSFAVICLYIGATR
jgi:hypothetical protein